MKAIISHDIDHITVWEHVFKDVIIPKFMVRTNIELAIGKISMNEYLLRWGDFFKNKWQNIDELITFNNVNHIPSSFFIAVKSGIGLNYSDTSVLLWMDQMKMRHCELGIHGIEFNDAKLMQQEFNKFREMSGQQNFGIRMHYVKNTNNTFHLLEETGYSYDSTVHAFENPYKVGNMWEFPFQIMDGWVIENHKKWQSKNLQQAKDYTRQLIDKAADLDLSFLGIDFHDRYFSSSFKTWLDWYVWLVEYLKQQKIETVNFNTAIQSLEAK